MVARWRFRVGNVGSEGNGWRLFEAKAQSREGAKNQKVSWNGGASLFWIFHGKFPSTHTAQVPAAVAVVAFGYRFPPGNLGSEGSRARATMH